MLTKTIEKRWTVASPPPAEMFGRFPGIDPVVVQLLWNRGMTAPEAVEEFLSPDYSRHVHDPFLFRDMERACARVWQAIERREKVVIHGDYDADGITGSVLLMDVFRAVAEKAGADGSLFTSYLPHREKEGYGLRAETVEMLSAQGAKLLITVDCGIGCAAEIALAREKGMDAIVVDHHQLPAILPDCPMLHPLVPGETYPFKRLAAAGVAFKFACGFIAYSAGRGIELERGFEKWLLDLVAIATVTDVMPLIGENRALLKFGLIVLNKTRRPGLRKIIEAAGLEFGRLDANAAGFYIGPRLNAASRMEHAGRAFEALTARGEEEAAALAEVLNRLNADRQRLTEEIMAAAREQLAGEPPSVVCLVKGEGWPAGIVGLVAGKLASELGRPVFAFGQEGERIVGSGRSIPGFDLTAAMSRAAEFIIRCGGHPQACGLTLSGEENYRGFCLAVASYAEETLGGADLRPALNVECELRTGRINMPLAVELEKFEPFGEGNPRPRFLLRSLLVSSVERVGKTGAHARIGVRGDSPRELKLIGFNQAETASRFAPGSRIDAVVEVSLDDWKGSKRVQVKAVDLRPAS